MEKYVVQSLELMRTKGPFGCYYTYLENGVCPYTKKTEAEFIRDGYKILSRDEFYQAWTDYENSLCNRWMEISEKEYNDQMNVLPPMKWFSGGFFISEAEIGAIHGFYQELGGKYYTSLQSLFSSRNEILENLNRAIAEGTVEDRTNDDEKEAA